MLTGFYFEFFYVNVRLQLQTYSSARKTKWGTRQLSSACYTFTTTYLPPFLIAVFQMNLDQLITPRLSSSTWNRTSGDKWHRFLTGRLPFLPPNQQSQSTEVNSKHWSHPFFIHHQTHEGRAEVSK